MPEYTLVEKKEFFLLNKIVHQLVANHEGNDICPICNYKDEHTPNCSLGEYYDYLNAQIIGEED